MLSECLYQLSAGQLTVAINGDTINAANVSSELGKADLAHLVKMHNLVKAACEASTASFRKTAVVIDPIDTSTRLSKASFAPKILEAMRADWLTEQPVLIEAQVLLRPKGKAPVTASFRLALAHAEPNESNVVCVRDDVTVRGAVPWGKRPSVALMMAQKNDLSGFLGDAEGPSHENWDHEYVKDRYSYAADTIRAVKFALPGAYDLLSSGDSDAPIENALINFFSWTPPEDAKKKKRAPQKKQIDAPLEIERRPQLVVVKKQKDGFIVSATGNAGDTGLFDVSIRCAYLIRFGDPFKEYSEYDFELEKGHVEARGAKRVETKGNKVLAKDAGVDFFVRVRGLDPNRDLDVRVRVTGPTEDETETKAA